MKQYEVIIIGAGAAGLMCAIEAGKRKRSILVVDHANKAGKKILMSGGGRCNFTNYDISPDNYLSHNPHFFISALSRYSQWDFIDLVQKHQIPFHEKTLGQLFCDRKSKDIVDMLLNECDKANVTIALNTQIHSILPRETRGFTIQSSLGTLQCHSLVIASGGLSIPTMGSSPFAYKIAEQFGINVWPTRAGLVPFTLHEQDKTRLAPLSGISVTASVYNKRIAFRDNILLTHRGLSGPAVLQVSSYWNPGEYININMLPDHNLIDILRQIRIEAPLKQLNTVLSSYLPKRIIDVFIPQLLSDKKMADLSNQEINTLQKVIQDWRIQPNGTEGYRTAEVTLGGIDCHAISSKTMESNDIEGLYFIGEALDVTGWLGGYNFQWAWSSGWAAGQYV